jgi:hypothetical protein
METMMAASQENWIKHRAYELWEQEGYPSGKDIEHWERAKLEYATLNPVAASGRKASAKAQKPAAAKAAKAPAAKTEKSSKPSTAKTASAVKAAAKSKEKVPAAAAAATPEQTKKRPGKAAAK